MSEATKQLTVDDIQKEIKPLSENGFVRFWQKIWRWWLGVWYGFNEKHPKLGPLVYKVFFFIVFSEGVTIWQFIVMTFLPYAFTGLQATLEWPGIPMGNFTDNNASYVIFGDPNGLGYFIAFEIAVFTAQCINFPLQRNITYRSHGNPWIQAMWYFIGWVLVSIATNAIWGVCNVFFTHWGWYLEGAEGLATVAGLIKTVLTGGVSLVVFFFIFMVIFPDNNKMAKNAKAKYEKLVAANAPAEKIAAAEAKMKLWEDKALKSNTEKEFVQAKSLVNTKALRYLTLVKNSEKANTEAEEAEKLLATDTSDKAKAKAEKLRAEADAYPEKIAKAFADAVEAIRTRDEKQAAYRAAHENAAAEPAAEASAK